MTSIKFKIAPSAESCLAGHDEIQHLLLNSHCFEDGGFARNETAGVRHALAEPAQDGRLRLWANGLAFSRSVMRIGVPGSSNTSRSEFVR